MPEDETTEETTTTEEEMTEDDMPTEEIVEEETETEEEMVEESASEDTKEAVAVDEEKGNLLTGFSISNLKDFSNDNKTMLLGGLALIIVLGILLAVYIKGRKDAYLYEM